MSGELGTLMGANAISGHRTGGNTAVGGNYVPFFTARVEYVLLDSQDKEKFDKLGGWKSIGTIECRPFVGNENTSNIPPIIAKPLNSTSTQYPLLNEIVLIYTGVSNQAQGGISNYAPEYYYMGPISVWNGPEQNLRPSAEFDKEKISGLFNSTGDVRRIIKAPGDITLEGRSGNAIRFGSSIQGFNSPFKGPDRSPLLVISNKQGEYTNNKEATFENINKDGSSMYMLSGHDVSFIPASLNYDSYNVDIESNPKSNYVEPKQSTGDVQEKSSEQVDMEVPVTKEVLPVIAPVMSPVTGSLENNQDLDDSNLPDNELQMQSFDDVENYIFTSDVVQYKEAVETSPKYETSSTVSFDFKNYSSLPPRILGNKQFQSFVSDQGVKLKVSEISRKIGVSENDLYMVIFAESGFKTTAVNEHTQATGLIQFMPKTAIRLGTSIQELYNMNNLQQLKYVEKYFSGRKFKNLYDLYLYTFVPIAVGKPLNWVFQWKGVSAYTVSVQNSAIANAAGKKPGVPLTVADFYKYVDKLINSKLNPKQPKK
jgi:hypothetical protein